MTDNSNHESLLLDTIMNLLEKKIKPDLKDYGVYSTPGTPDRVYNIEYSLMG